jgi:hypothetical protein
MSFTSVTCGYSSCKAKVKKPLIHTLALCGGSLNILIAAQTN